ncbi:IS66 family insertion sequence element accessory protein TnpB [Alkaliphilus serpentinus]|uniref:IS66 family insertion sequence element accessory protein TnpB n=1 Tax=Alkaliphilus serpentinus TaxID=1482731 RepID=A0A833MCS5_9FIRM|nr:IS66 family insertion sequence element accessory protein TnpB [Alkaliphilus serpentinus]KAB3526304.1 IS66 family insertion sequence element accessory protein TnpB [Alkaliphilus serpentinus]
MLRQNHIDKVHLALGPTDLRKSIDGLALIVSQSFKLDPFSRSLFVFSNRKRDKLKILEWDHNGFWLHYKRLEKDTFDWPDGANGTAITIGERELRWLLDGLSIHQRHAHKEVLERVMI